MRRTREEAAETRQRIVEAASRMFRGRGISTVSVAEVMGSLGLTVGGFYRHFESKAALIAEAIESASLETLRRHEAVSGKRAERATALLDSYLSNAHRAHADRGCPVAALCSEVGHETRPIKEAFTRALRGLLAVLEGVIAEDRGRRDEVLRVAAEMVGAIVLARATSDDALAADILRAVRTGVTRDRATK
jgi:TetR/AcrR family transcriptional repressor of nem operon